MLFRQVLHQLDSFVVVNVGGLRQRLDPTLLRRFPETRLGRLLCCSSNEDLLELCDDFSPSDMEFYFDRSPSFFCYVVNFYLTGKLHLVDELCVVSFLQEIEYWGIEEHYLDLCCSSRFLELMESTSWDQKSNDQQLQNAAAELSYLEDGLEMFEGSWCGNVRRSIWIRLEDPGFSTSAKVMAVASMSVVFVSIVAMCLNSMSDFHQVDSDQKSIENPALALIENLCILLFSAEFTLRLAAAPAARKFFCSPLNIIDLLSILPFYVTLICDKLGENKNTELEDVVKVVQILRLMRVFRILKLARHSAGLRSLGSTLRHSAHEMGQLVLFLSLGVFLFSALIYFVEKESGDSDLQTIPIGWWWATITMTTVGYGDVIPLTSAGRLIGAVCIICGLLVVALPVTNIFNKFSKFHQSQKGLRVKGTAAEQTQTVSSSSKPPEQ